jgi:hypothetical protein
MTRVGDCPFSEQSHKQLKVPKREIFDRSDFPDSYTIKSLCVGDLGVKIERIFKNKSFGQKKNFYGAFKTIS